MIVKAAFSGWMERYMYLTLIRAYWDVDPRPDYAAEAMSLGYHGA